MSEHFVLTAVDDPRAAPLLEGLEQEYGERCCALHDPLACAIAIGQVIATVAPAVDVVVDQGYGPGRGQTICDLRNQRTGPKDVEGAHVRVVLATDQPLAPVLLERLLGYGG